MGHVTEFVLSLREKVLYCFTEINSESDFASPVFIAVMSILASTVVYDYVKSQYLVPIYEVILSYGKANSKDVEVQVVDAMSDFLHQSPVQVPSQTNNRSTILQFAKK